MLNPKLVGCYKKVIALIFLLFISSALSGCNEERGYSTHKVDAKQSSEPQGSQGEVKYPVDKHEASFPYPRVPSAPEENPKEIK